MSNPLPPKSMARALRSALAERNIDASHSECLEIVARQHGLRDWNTLVAATANETAVGLSVFVEHGRQREAADFYCFVFAAKRLAEHFHDGRLMAADLRLGAVTLSVAGSNPRRESEPALGGPFSPKSAGAVGMVCRLSLANAQTVLNRAIEAGAVTRDPLQLSSTGRRAASFFDPFGHLWGIVENEPAR